MSALARFGRIGTLVLWAAALAVGCGAGADGGADACAEAGRYDDGVCDTGCPNPDPDCQVSGDPCVSPDRYGDGNCDLDCDHPDPDCGGESSDPCLDPNRYADGTCDTGCWSADPDCEVAQPGEITLVFANASPNPFAAGGGASVELSVLAAPSSSVTVDRVRVDVTGIGGTSVDLAESAGVWTGAFALPNTVPSATYVLPVAAHGVDAGAGGAEVTAEGTITLVVQQQAGLHLSPSANAEPNPILGGEAIDVWLPAYLTATFATVSDVTVDLTLLGGPSAEPLHDDGTHGDLEAGDGIYGTTWSLPASTPNGLYFLPVTATGLVDGTLPVIASADVSVLVRGRLDLTEPAFLEGTVTWWMGDTRPILVAERGIEQAATVRVRASASHGATLTSVTIDLSAFGQAPDAPMYDDGPAATGGHEPVGEAAGNGTFHRDFTIPATQPASERFATLRATASDPGGDHDAVQETVVLVHDAGYDVTAETGVQFQSIRSSGTPLDMSQSRPRFAFALPDGFTFPFYGVPYDAITLYSSGFARPGSIESIAQPVEGDAYSYAHMELAPMVAVCQSRDISVSDFQVFAEIQGTAPSRRAVFEWAAGLFNGGSIAAQLILDESGTLTVHYGAMDDPAAPSSSYSRWALLLVNDITEFDQVYGWTEAPPLDDEMSSRRWIFTPR